MVLTTNDQILKWLDDHDGFANANLAYTFNLFSRELILEIEQRDRISLAGETELVRLFFVIVSGVEIKSGHLTSEEGLSLYNMYPLQDRTGLIWDVWEKDEVAFTCTEVYVRETKDIMRTTKPVLSNSTLIFKISIEEKPDAVYWIKRLGDAGYEVKYIGYFGDELSIGELDDYTGLSIIPKTNGEPLWIGVKFCRVEHANGILKIQLELQNSRIQDFWEELIRTVTKMNVVEVRNGNVVFDQSEWNRFVYSGVLPDRLLK
jgi:hypothetical protein